MRRTNWLINRSLGYLLIIRYLLVPLSFGVVAYSISGLEVSISTRTSLSAPSHSFLRIQQYTSAAAAKVTLGSRSASSSLAAGNLTMTSSSRFDVARDLRTTLVVFFSVLICFDLHLDASAMILPESFSQGRHFLAQIRENDKKASMWRKNLQCDLFAT